MKVKIIAFNLLFFLSGCDLSFSLGSEKGTFQTDKEMTDFLVENIDAFTSLAESKTECNSFWAENGNDQIVTDECQEIFDSLGLLGILYSSYTKNDGSDELIQWMSFSTYDVTRGLFNGYSKGYRYNGAAWYSALEVASVASGSGYGDLLLMKTGYYNN